MLLIVGIAVLALLGIIAVVFFEHKNPASTIAWVVVLIFLPLIGVVAYVLFGSGFRVKKKKKYKIKSVLDDIYNEFILQRLDVNALSSFWDNPGDLTRALNYFAYEGEGMYTRNNRIEIFTDGKTMFSRMLDDIRNARKHVHLLYYIFREDGIGGEIVSLLTEKAKNGVEVRLLYDSIGSFLSMGSKFKELMKAGGEVLAFAPVFSNINSSLRLNYRNHRKITVIDGVVGYTGGMNVGDEYLGLDKKLVPWRDTQLRLSGSAVWFLQERFLMDWGYAGNIELKDEAAIVKYFPHPVDSGDTGVQIVSSGPDTEGSPIKSGFLNMLYAAKKTAYIQTPYLALDESLFDALRVASCSGVDVRLMIPGIGDSWIVQRATYGYARQLLAFGIKIYMYHGFLHAKTIVCDTSAASIGTANMTNRSFSQNFEVNAFIYDEVFAKRCLAIFLHDQKNCLQLTEEWFAEQNWLERASCSFARLMAPLI